MSTTFISYAQNFEDVMLWRALGQVARGFYVDIGAQHPLVDSVSRAFYERGWRGINVEPSSTYARLLSDDRPSDETLNVALAESEGMLEFFEIPDTGLSTGDPTIAARHERSGYSVVRLRVPCVTLDTLLAPLARRDVHWMKIDVEGFEERVLRGWVRATVRPWIVVVESTEPLTPRDTRQEWERHLLEKGYQHVYSDGLNRFYVSRERGELASAFRFPPNVFDEFELSGMSSFGLGLTRRIHESEARGRDQERELQLAIGSLQTRQNEVSGELERATSLITDLEGGLKAQRDLQAALEGRVQEQIAALARGEHALAVERESRASLQARQIETSKELERVSSLNAHLEGRLTAQRDLQAALEGRVQEQLATLARGEHALAAERATSARLEGDVRRLTDAHRYLEVDRDIERALRTNAEGLLRSVLNSRSWRITAPLRWSANRLRALLGVTRAASRDLMSLPRGAARAMLIRARAHLQAHPARKAQVAALLARMGPLNAKLRGLALSRDGGVVGERGRERLARAALPTVSPDNAIVARRLDYLVELEARLEQQELAHRHEIDRLTSELVSLRHRHDTVGVEGQSGSS